MASCNYNKSTRTFTVVWKDYAKEALGEKYPYSRKSKKWQGEKHPTAKEKREEEKELIDFARKEESKSRDKADFIRIHGEDEEINATGYLTNLSEEELSRTNRPKERKEARRVINEFVAWLNMKHKKIPLHKINRVIAKEYYKHLETHALAFSTLKRKITRLSYIFKQVTINFEDNNLNYNNPFSSLPLDEVIKPKEPTQRKPYTDLQLQDFLHSINSRKKVNKWKTFQYFAIYYFLIVTGWRINDILLLKWQQIDLEKRIIKMTHSKTQDKKIKTELYITDLMSDILAALYWMKDKAPKKNKDFVFSLRNENDRTLYIVFYFHFKTIRKELQLDEYEENGKMKTHIYTIHSFRHTVCTRLTQAGIQEAKINYLVGHAPKTTEEKTYLSLESKDTEKMCEYMEDYAKARYFFEKLELTKELYKSEYYLDLIAKRAKQKHEMMKKASNERFIPLP